MRGIYTFLSGIFVSYMPSCVKIGQRCIKLI